MTGSFCLHYLESVRKQFAYYKQLGERTFEQLNDDQLFWQYNEASNSIAVMVQHLWGNMRSRWTDFFTSDGEKPWRQRDREFEPEIATRQEMMDKWEAGWKCLFEALATINQDNFDQPVYIRGQQHSVTEAINRQLAHYAYHVGQIVYLGRMQLDRQWQSLTIPKGQSDAFNREKFAGNRQQDAGGRLSDGKHPEN